MNIKQRVKKAIKKVSDIRYHEFKLYLGKAENPTYIIRFFDREGLMSILYKALGQIEYAHTKSYIPYIDMEHFPNMYRQKDVNAWELFFEQPAVPPKWGYSKKRIISACWPTRDDKSLFGTYWANAFCDYERKGMFFENNIRVEKSIKKAAEKIEDEKNIGECIGVLLRGTDYVSLKPKGHPIQPTIDEAIKKIDEFKSSYRCNIFLATEDKQIRGFLKDRYKDSLIVIDDDFTVGDYKEGKMLADCIGEDDAVAVGKTYLLKIVLLSKCKYLVAGRTNGSLMALIMNKGRYEDSYIFDKGMY